MVDKKTLMRFFFDTYKARQLLYNTNIINIEWFENECRQEGESDKALEIIVRQLWDLPPNFNFGDGLYYYQNEYSDGKISFEKAYQELDSWLSNPVEASS